jgi:type IV secretory pathway VirB2 component (pilin)
MMMIATIQQASLSDQPQSSAIAAAAGWVSDLLFGPLATAIAVIAIGWIGFAMLSGRIDLRRGLAVVFGCFLLFGAWGIADGLRSSATVQRGSTAAAAPA